MVTAVDSISEHYLTQFSKAEKNLPGNEFIQNMRVKALHKFISKGFPTSKDEQWKYTSLYPLTNKNFNFIDKQIRKNIDISPVSEWYIFLDDIQKSKLPDGIDIYNFSEGLQTPEILRYLNKSGITHHSPLYDLNLALMSHGYIIEVKKNVKLEQPIHIICGSSIDSVIANIRNIIIIKDNADVNFLEQYIGENTYCNNITTEIFLDEGARCNINCIQEESRQSYHLSDILVNQNRNSFFSWNNFSFGSALARNYLEVSLSEGAECKLHGMSVLHGAQHVDHNVLVNHLGPNSSSFEEFKGVYSGCSQGVFKGDVKVDRDVKNIISKQLNKNILLSNQAKVNTQPRLEIFNNDVQCSHGATVGQLDKEALFYLQTRGLSKDDSKRMLVSAFVKSILGNISDKTIMYYIDPKIEKILLIL